MKLETGYGRDTQVNLSAMRVFLGLYDGHDTDMVVEGPILETFDRAPHEEAHPALQVFGNMMQRILALCTHWIEQSGRLAPEASTIPVRHNPWV